MDISLRPVATVRNSRITPIDDDWQEIISIIELDKDLPSEVFLGMSDFSHFEIIYFFDKVEDQNIAFSGHPRGNPNYPRVGIFAQRKKDRPNKLGLATVELISFSERTITVKGLDAIEGTPVLDIKPVFREFEPKTPIRQPEWVGDLMKHYW
jgi:tRNA (adenine37-N6)-methyltransferase